MHVYFFKNNIDMCQNNYDNGNSYHYMGKYGLNVVFPRRWEAVHKLKHIEAETK